MKAENIILKMQDNYWFFRIYAQEISEKAHFPKKNSFFQKKVVAK